MIKRKKKTKNQRMKKKIIAKQRKEGKKERKERKEKVE